VSKERRGDYAVNGLEDEEEVDRPGRWSVLHIYPHLHPYSHGLSIKLESSGRVLWQAEAKGGYKRTY
jgi:hypothetical protein